MKNQEENREIFLEFSSKDTTDIDNIIYPYIANINKRVHETLFVDGIGFFSLVYYKNQKCYHMDCFLFSLEDDYTFEAFDKFLNAICSGIKKESVNRKDFISPDSFAFLNYIKGEYSYFNLEKNNSLSYSISVDNINYTYEEIQALGFWLVRNLKQLIEYTKKEQGLNTHNFQDYFIKVIISRLNFLNYYYEDLYGSISEEDVTLEKISFLDFIKLEKEKSENKSGSAKKVLDYAHYLGRNEREENLPF